MYTFETYMQQYRDKYWAVKLQDSVWNLVNHNYYLLVKKNIDNRKEQVSICPWDQDCTKLMLTMTHGTQQAFNNRIKKLKGADIDVQTDSADDGGFVTFNPEDLDIMCQLFKIKKKQKRNLTEDQRQELSERLSRARKGE